MQPAEPSEATMATFPGQLKYTKDHEWIDASQKPTPVGVTGYAIEQLGDIVHVALPDVGENFAAGAAFGTIESTKTVSDLYMPMAGKIVEINQTAVDSPESLQEDPYGGWLVKLEPAGADDGSHLMTPEAYESFVSEQDA